MKTEIPSLIRTRAEQLLADIHDDAAMDIEDFARIYAVVQDLLSLVASPSEKCDGNHGGPRCPDPGCWNDDPSEPTATFEDGWRAGLAHARDVFRRHDWQGQLEEILAVVDAVHEREP